MSWGGRQNSCATTPDHSEKGWVSIGFAVFWLHSSASELLEGRKSCSQCFGAAARSIKLLWQCFRAAQSSKLRFSSDRSHSALENTCHSDFEATSRSKLIRNHVRSNCSKIRGSAPLHSVSLCSVPPSSVHGYARVHISIYIYISMGAAQ